MLTPKQFAERIGVHVRTLARWSKSGTLRPAIVLPNGDKRYSEDQVEALKQAEK